MCSIIQVLKHGKQGSTYRFVVRFPKAEPFNFQVQWTFTPDGTFEEGGSITGTSFFTPIVNTPDYFDAQFSFVEGLTEPFYLGYGIHDKSKVRFRKLCNDGSISPWSDVYTVKLK